MNKLLAGIAAVLSGVAILLTTQTQTFSRVDAAGPKLRMLIAGSGSPMRAPLRLKFHKECVEKIPGGQLIITDNSFHGTINFEEPELVIRTIRQAIEKARALKTRAETK
jgi:hypothetical protein